MLSAAPVFYNQSDLYKSIMQAVGVEFDTAEQVLQEIADQARVETATYGIAMREQEYNLPIDLTLSIEERRGKLLAKIRGAGPTTAALVSDVVESYGWGRVHVEEDFEGYTVTVVFQSAKGIPPNDSIIKVSVQEVLPAHIGLIWLYLFLTWDEFDAKGWTWDQFDAKGLTWDQLEVQ